MTAHEEKVAKLASMTEEDRYNACLQKELKKSYKNLEKAGIVRKLQFIKLLINR